MNGEKHNLYFQKEKKPAGFKNLLLLVAGTIFILITGINDLLIAKPAFPERGVKIANGPLAGSSFGTDSFPAVLKKMKNVHPRMHLTAQSMSLLKAKMDQTPYKEMLEKLLVIADKLVLSGPPPFREGREKDEQLWQRQVGNAIPELAMAYCMTGVKKYLHSARDYMLTSASYLTWGAGALDNTDLATGHQLYGMSIGYDWLYSDLDVSSRDSIRNCLLKRGGRLYELLAMEKVWWHRYYLQNHQHVNLTGLAAAGFALYGEANVDQWILLPLKKFRQVIATNPPDGGWHEGIPYTGYALEYILKFLDLSADLLDENFFPGSSYLKNVASFRLYGSIPRDYWVDSKSTVMSLGDSPRMDYYGPDYLLRKLASEYKDRNAQWLADKMDSSKVTKPEAFFLNLLWLNPSVKSQPPTALPTSKHFNDLDIVYMRSGWDGKESLSMFKCGPPLGYYATAYYNYDPCAGHTHPDVGTFQIFSHGEWLITDEGYAFKRTAYQNTLIINGKGQIGEGTWFSGRLFMGAKDLPRLVYTSTGKDYDYFIGNAKPAYFPSSHLTAFFRHFLYLKPDCWIIADEVQADSTSLFEFNYHSNLPFNAFGSNQFISQGERGSMNVTVLKPTDAKTQTFLQDIDGTAGRISNRLNVLKVSTANKTSDLFITVIESYPSGKTAAVKATILSSKKNDVLVLKTNNKIRRFKIMQDRTNKDSPLFVETLKNR